VYIGIFNVDRFRTALIDLRPDLGKRQHADTTGGSLQLWPITMPEAYNVVILFAVNDLYGRLFATWTTLTCGLCLICARNPTNAAIYGKVLVLHSSQWPITDMNGPMLAVQCSCSAAGVQQRAAEAVAVAPAEHQPPTAHQPPLLPCIK
jgi:hypothetical protein